jgi:hypothetical protein
MWRGCGFGNVCVEIILVNLNQVGFHRGGYGKWSKNKR